MPKLKRVPCQAAPIPRAAIPRSRGDETCGTVPVPLRGKETSLVEVSVMHPGTGWIREGMGEKKEI